MKKLVSLLSIIALFVVSTPVYARIAGFGITAGMNISKVDWRNIEAASPEPEKGWYAGVSGMFSIPVLGFGFDGGLIYSQERVNLDKGTKSAIAHYVSIPVHLRHDFRFILLEDVFVPYIYAGPQFNYSMNDLKFEDFEGASVEAILKQSNAWRLDIGLGCLLFDRLQCSYSYGIPMGEKVDVNLGDAVLGNYRSGAHRIGLTYYF